MNDILYSSITDQAEESKLNKHIPALSTYFYNRHFKTGFLVIPMNVHHLKPGKVIYHLWISLWGSAHSSCPVILAPLIPKMVHTRIISNIRPTVENIWTETVFMAQVGRLVFPMARKEPIGPCGTTEWYSPLCIEHVHLGYGNTTYMYGHVEH